jgi:hypothetical protein
LQRRAQELLRDCSEHVRRIGLTNELNQLPGLVRFIDDEGMRPGIETFAPDPAMRDIGLAALLRDPRMARDAPIDSGSSSGSSEPDESGEKHASRSRRRDFLVGRAGLEPATKGL